MSGGDGSASSWRHGILCLLVLLMVVAVWVAGEAVAHHLGALEAGLAELGAGGIVLFLALYVVLTCLLIPESLLSVMAGVVFGFAWGFVWALAGAVMAALLQYGLARRWLSRRILAVAERRPTWRALPHALRRDERRLQWLLRLAPFNPALVSYLLGAIGVDFRRFVLACLALAPHVAVEVYAGHAARHFVHASQTSDTAALLHGCMLIGGVVIVVVVLHRIGQGLRRALAETTGNERD